METTENISSDQVTETIDGLTALGREAMRVIGEGRNISFFDHGVNAGSGSWGECLTGDLGHKSSGVINRLAKLGLFDVSHDEDGAWFALTELGAAVARKLAGATVEEKAAEPLFPATPEAPKLVAELKTVTPDPERDARQLAAYADAPVIEVLPAAEPKIKIGQKVTLTPEFVQLHPHDGRLRLVANGGVVISFQASGLRTVLRADTGELVAIPTRFLLRQKPAAEPHRYGALEDVPQATLDAWQEVVEILIEHGVGAVMAGKILRTAAGQDRALVGPFVHGVYLAAVSRMEVQMQNYAQDGSWTRLGQTLERYQKITRS